MSNLATLGEAEKQVLPPVIPTIHLMARNAEEIKAANMQLVDWVGQRLSFAQADFDTLTANLHHARKQKWKVTGIQAQLRTAKDLVHRYIKIKAALMAGYTIVPNLPLTLFAVRVADGARVPSGDHTTESRWRDADELSVVQPGMLPAGDGQYVSADANRRYAEYKEKDSSGKEVAKYHFFNDPETQIIDFPVSLVRPEVMTATQQAMALKIFDRIGIIDGKERKKDPMIVGQIVGPKKFGRWSADRYQISFLIAWFIDARSI